MKTESTNTNNRRLMQIIALSLSMIGIVLASGSIAYMKNDWKQHMELVEEFEARMLETKEAE